MLSPVGRHTHLGSPRASARPPLARLGFLHLHICLFPTAAADTSEWPEPAVPSVISPELPSACQEGLCHNGGTCHPAYLPTGARSFRCDCPLHFTGRFCEKAGEKNFGEQFLHLYLVEGRPTVRFSCGQSQNILTVSINQSISKGVLTPVTISYMLPVGSSGGYCMIEMSADGNPPVQHRLSLSYQASQITFGSIFLGNVPVHAEVHRCAGQILGYKGCVRDFQVNNKELFIIDEALGGRNVENCNVPICDYNPCRNGGTCTR
ncbi:PREDICTED: protein eyes shut homolog [Tinamus guttatus]|uniref:protein eyes shut homolog n=1 Tax=Tinamus guttatus TaxID=94827 RepID=UPI00052EDDC8|nr:PREDICTED: protein eyes shut homolog [Tinamus guttatus]